MRVPWEPTTTAFRSRIAGVKQCFGIATIFVCSTVTILLLHIIEKLQEVPLGLSTDHANIRGQGVASLDVYIPPNRKDDTFMNVDIAFDGKLVPLSIDTSFGDLIIATDNCDTVDPESGCYGVQSPYQTNATTKYLPNATFDTHLGAGQALGNLSSISMHLAGLTIDNTSVALIDWASKNEFHDGSFTGVLGLGLRSVSLAWLQYRCLPMMDTLVTQYNLNKSLFSLRLPRYADPERKLGKLTFGAVEDIPESQNLVFRDIAAFSRNSDHPEHTMLQAWSTVLEGVRMNGADIAVSPGRYRLDAKHVAVLDSGAPSIHLPFLNFRGVVQQFDGLTTLESHENGEKVFFECRKHQVFELKMHGRWYPVDPLDLLVPNSRRVVNGTEMCEASLRSNYQSFGDSLLGMPFLRSVFAVFDYVENDMYKVSPRLGLASMVDEFKAVERYELLHSDRMY